MKKIIVLILILGFLFLTGRFVYKNIKEQDLENILSFRSEIPVTPTPLRLPNGIITEKAYSEKRYLILTVKIPNQAKIVLIPNFSEKLSGEDLVKTNNCDIGINGGFYLEKEKPLGLFKVDGKLLGKQSQSSIANAFVFLESDSMINFGKLYPNNIKETGFIFQTGPLIIPANRKLKLVRDDYARRSLLAKDRSKNIYLVNVTDKESLASGPKLAEIPIIFQQLKAANILPFEELVNLDGGSASFFYSRDESGDLTFSSWSPIGSLLCIKYQ
ncbi:hypothetical protein A3D78_03805 [Candidatus Gottesmanbacteria bacterium RIFCSPHIGHO2_02_FULL_39_14]|uniref:Phosphodiester glycosidase domain-containing protein n=2 Tax=Candidatus Gottesmaniibacteriota TaxID=1752720 RepID=A0A1F5ZXR9_9BACT|nr:MAG: hypothetical protein A2153_02490 [Candidatus Gottesmanbacteria bacterium RBG_16_38_7b]OGG17163.1 MAG: hypothetical protein A3D78_03805 [Candidatus Gottesmanbacteria bacterium RIFCSPHIGHO2_02_FULL_39_14]